MARIAEVKREQSNPRQQQLHDDFLRSRPRKTLTGPFAVLAAARQAADIAPLARDCVVSRPCRRRKG